MTLYSQPSISNFKTVIFWAFIFSIKVGNDMTETALEFREEPNQSAARELKLWLNKPAKLPR
jgi:hypothetical protein